MSKKECGGVGRSNRKPLIEALINNAKAQKKKMGNIEGKNKGRALGRQCENKRSSWCKLG